MTITSETHPFQHPLYRKAVDIGCELSSRGVDVTDPYAVERFLREHNREAGKKLVLDIVDIARTHSEWCDREILFEMLDENVPPGALEACEETLDHIAEFAVAFVPPACGESAPHYAARMLVHQLAWRRGEDEHAAIVREYVGS